MAKSVPTHIRCPDCGQLCATFKELMEHQKVCGSLDKKKSDAKQNFVHLHAHTEYSILDGVGQIKGMIEKAAKDGAKALAITDHGTVSGHVAFQYACTSSGVKPIFGCEFYTCEDHLNKTNRIKNHLVLLAKNEIGYKNLIKLASIAAIDGFYYKPRIDFGLLEKHHEGLICLSACIGGEIPQAILAEEIDYAYGTAEKFKKLFGEDFYLELQPNRLPEQKVVNGVLEELAKVLKIELVATNDAHYPEKDDWKAHEIILCIKTHAKISDKNRFKFDDNTFYLMTEEEILNAFKEYHTVSEETIKKAIENTLVVAEKCDYLIQKKDVVLPMFKLPDEILSENEFLDLLVHQGFKKNYVNKKIQQYSEDSQISFEDAEKIYKDRLKMELEVIHSLNFERYILIVWEIYQFCKKEGIVCGPGRGSVAGSLLAYTLGITTVDPIENGLYFGRFLTPERIDWPDIDMDFEDSRRHEVVQHLKDLYGEDKVANIVTYGRMKGKLILKDVARVFNVPYHEVNNITDFIVQRSGGDARVSFTVQDAVKSFKEVKQFADKYPEVMKYAQKLEGQVRQKGIHAAGIVVSEKPIEEVCPVELKDGKVVTSFDGPAAENAGLLKLDILGLKTMTIIKETLKNIKDSTGEDIKLEEISLADKGVFKQLTDGLTAGVFQLETKNMTKLCRKVEVDTFEDIVNINALGRPGTMRSGATARYIAIKHKKTNPDYIHPAMKPITEPTYSIMLFQEQIMRVLADIGNFDWANVDIHRKIISKSQGTAAFEKARNRFVKGAMENGISEKMGNKLYTQMIQFGSYCLTGDTIIYRCSSNQYAGRELTIKEAFDNQKSQNFKNRGLKVLSMDKDNFVRYNTIKKIWGTGKKEVFWIKTVSNKTIRASAGHRFLVNGKWTQVKDISVGDNIRVSDLKLPKNITGNGHGKGGFGELCPNKRKGEGKTPALAAQRKRLKEKYSNLCQKCGSDKFCEMHHVDENISNNSDENTLWLCRKCHRTIHNKMNPKIFSRFQKGYYTQDEEILEIKFVGERETYDIEMVEEPRNFIANGFVSHNSFNKSHAAAYSTISYWCGYLKNNYPNEFFAAALSHAEGKEQEYIKEARKLGVQIHPPDINESGFNFVSKNNKILGSLRGIKGLGDKGIKAIVEHKPYKNFQDFLDKIPKGKINKKSIEALIKIGTFGEKGAKTIYDNFAVGKSVYQKTLFDFGDKLIETREWTPKEIEQFQTEFYILPPIVHPIEKYKELIKKMEISSDFNLISEIDFDEQKGETIWLRGVITQVRYQNWGDKLAERPTPEHSMYKYYSQHPWNARHCIFDVEDETNFTLCSVFPDVFEKYEHTINKGVDTPILIKGRLGFNIDRIYVQEIYDLNELDSGVKSKELSKAQKSLFENPLREYEHLKHTSLCDLGSSGTAIGIFGQPKLHTDKNGKEMAFVPFEDMTGSITIICFASDWVHKKGIIKDGAIAGINLRKMQGDGKSYSASKIVLLQAKV